MKPLHLAVGAAVLAVALVVVLMLASGGDRHDARRGTDRPGATDGAGRPEADGSGGADGSADGGPAGLTLTLKVVMPDGSPAGGATAELLGPATLAADTDAEGKLQVKGLRPGLYGLLARKDKATGSLSFELERTRDLGTLRLEQSVVIRGTVYDPHGRPLPGALVEAVTDEERGFNMTTFVRLFNEPEHVAAQARTGADGVYELRVGAGGTYGLRASARGYAQEGEPSRVYAADASGLDFWLFPGAAVAGRVLDVRGPPIAGARVMLLDVFSALGRRVPKAEATTAADGTFALAVLPRDDAMLVVRATGYATHMEPNLKVPAPDVQITLEAGVSIRLRTVDEAEPARPAPRINVALVYRGGFAAGETDDDGRLLLENLPTKGSRMFGNEQQGFLWGGDFLARKLDIPEEEPGDGLLDLGDVGMTRGGVVRGKVRDRVTGEGVAGARVRAMGGGDMELMMLDVPVTSGPDGAFEMRGVNPGASTLTAEHPDYVSELNPMMFMGMRGGGGGGEPLFPAGVREVQRDVELTPAQSVIGVVYLPDGAPASGATVEAEDEMAMLARMLGSGPRAATTDAQGRFTLGGLAKGQEATLSATHRDYGPAEMVKARAGEGALVELRLTEPLRIQGVVADEAGEPVAAARVTVERKEERGRGTVMMGGMQDEGVTRPAVTDAEGRYLLRNAPPGDLVVTIDHGDYMAEKIPVLVRPGTKTKDLGTTTLRRGHGIEGVAVDDKGEPLAGLRIVVSWDYQGGGMAVQNLPGRTNGNAQTDEKGRFKVYGLREGRFELRTWQQGFYADRLVVRTGTRDARLVLRKAGTLVGRVTGNGLPVDGASVRAQIAEAGGENQFVGWSQTDSAGRFRMETVPPDRPFNVTITHDAFREHEVENVVAAERTQDFVLERGLTVAGRVVDEDGAPVAGAQIMVMVDARWAKQVRTDRNGGFEAGGLGDGRITVQLGESDQGFIATEPRAVTAGDRSIRFVARRGESIGGFVYGADGAGANRVRVEAVSADGTVAGQAWVWQDDGAFEVRGLPRGTYTLRAHRTVRDGPAPPPVEVAGVATGATGVTIRLAE